ncbi:MAG: adenylyltransferase/cytidyltransferase family protein [Thermodesulfovibrionales bacterium]|nr:adenylyltransferase/cytidyltransferase family protein [Thermodesulfovibrionales bacterium]MDP3111414.1 adenylyltransferase/cytidyltransferase family protein [Thermodesulfovibrionales bacterium]
MKKNRVVCAGTFDHLHLGHANFLKQAKALGDELVVIVARDENVKRIKNILSEHNEAERKENVEKTRIPDKVVLGLTEKDIFIILEQLKPDIIALGYDQRVSEEAIQKRLPNCKIVRLKPFKPDKYKSSYYRKKTK